jgi:uncharacterized protein YdhG (YjbR/CyaY superfamily)
MARSVELPFSLTRGREGLKAGAMTEYMPSTPRLWNGSLWAGNRQPERVTPSLMNQSPESITTIDQYIAASPEELRPLLTEMRATIKSAAPEATERISYRIPTFCLHGNLVHFAAFRNHIGFYPTPSAIAAFEDELRPYEKAKGSVRFPIDEPLPLDLIRSIVRFRVEENTPKGRKNGG